MSEYMKKKQPVQPSQMKKAEAVDPRREMTNGIPNSVLQDIFAGKRKADASMMGHSDTLAPSIAAKMSRAFGMDVSSVQVSRSDKMKGTGMQGMAQGNKVVLSSDINLNTMEGQAVLGHELSHIRAQSRGIGMGNSGLYENASLEHQADMEGMRAARGLFASREGGMEMGLGMSYGLGMQGVENVTSLSGGMGMSAGAPMQAKKPDAPGSEQEANQMAYDFATERVKKLDMQMLADQYDFNNTYKDEMAELKKYVRSLSIPKAVSQGWEEKAKESQLSGKRKKNFIAEEKENYYNRVEKAARGLAPGKTYFDKPKRKRDYARFAAEATTNAERDERVNDPYSELEELSVVDERQHENAKGFERQRKLLGVSLSKKQSDFLENFYAGREKAEKRRKKKHWWWPF